MGDLLPDKSKRLPRPAEHRVRALDGPSTDLSLNVTSELIEQVAKRAAELLASQPEQPAEGWLRGADRIAAYIGAPRSRVYALVSAKEIPIHHDGSALIARRSELDAWLRDGGGKRR